MEKGARVWINESEGEQAWILCSVVQKTDASLTVAHVDNPKRTETRKRLTHVTSTVKYDGVELANAPLSAEVAASGDSTDDLITLPHLHEPAILHAVHERFHYGRIYTWTGPVLIAVNPFQRLPLYTQELLEAYRRQGLFKSQGLQTSSSSKPLGPHVYAIADSAYRQMMRGDHKPQAVLISGESGAGKTESTKIVMLYLTTLGSGGAGDLNTPSDDSAPTSASSSSSNEIMDRVLQSNPILEAFGNARTLRNDNSSRFGKFIELGFSRSGQLLGAKVDTYLLEKVRLGFHASGERNYHIFYQLLRGATPVQHTKYYFNEGHTGGLELTNYFHYTGQGGAPHLREFTDEEGLAYTLKAMRKMGWSDKKIDKVLALTAGLLHLGQVSFSSGEVNGEESSEIQDENVKTLSYAAELIGVDVDAMKSALTQRIMEARGERMTLVLNCARALDARDALTKTIYGALFLWVVQQVNDCIIWNNSREKVNSIGVLDIFGFESFAVNSFEQLCINFTNEALQQQFNKFIFKMEQAEYEREKIEWAFIDFPDNQDCLDLIQGRPDGILAMLDDECRLPKGSDRNWANRLYKMHLDDNKDKVNEEEEPRFLATAIQKSKAMFCIRHFAGVVVYSSETGFLEKNKDEIPLAAKALFETAPNELVREIYSLQLKMSEESVVSKSGNKSNSKTRTVGMQFKDQLSDLMRKVETTEPHYIRCLKPNDKAKPKMLVRSRLTEQLRYGGVLEAVRVARMGYPVRLPHADFFSRYRLLLPQSNLPWTVEESSSSPQGLCTQLVDQILKDGELQHEKKYASSEYIGMRIRLRQKPLDPIDFPRRDVQLGVSKVFLRKPPHDALEAHRVFHQNASATIIQAYVRGIEQHKRFLILASAARLAQRWYRGCVGRAKWWALREAKAGMLLTKVFRMLLLRKKYIAERNGAIKLQAQFRGRMVRKNFAAVTIQTAYRRHVHLTAFIKLRSALITLQNVWRCIAAEKIYQALRAEQKDIGKLKQNNEQLKAEMASLRAMLKAQADGAASKELNQAELNAKEEEIARLEKRVKELEELLKTEKDAVAKLEAELKERPTIEVRNPTLTAQRPISPVPLPPAQEAAAIPLPGSPLPTLVRTVPVDSVELKQHLAAISRLEQELEQEKSAHRLVDAQLVQLKAKMAGIELTESDFEGFLTSEESPPKSVTSEDLDDSPSRKRGLAGLGNTTMKGLKTLSKRISDVNKKTPSAEPASPLLSSPTAQDNIFLIPNQNLSIDNAEEPSTPPSLKPVPLFSPAEYFPFIKRGGMAEGDEKEVMTSTWKPDVASRREREQNIVDEVKRFENKMKKYKHALEEGADATLWQLHRNENEKPEFVVKATPVYLKLDARGNSLVLAQLLFTARGGYLSKALGRGDKNMLEPISLHDVIDVKPGCVGFDSVDLPVLKSKTGRVTGKGENKHSSLFMTISASPTPLASHRSLFIRFKTRTARNDTLMSLRRLLADLQVNEGLGVSSIHAASVNAPPSPKSQTRMSYVSNGPDNNGTTLSNGFVNKDPENAMIPLSLVHQELNKERESYDRLIIMLLSGSTDVKDKEDEILMLRGKLDGVTADMKEKDRIQADDSKLIMQLSQKLEKLLMDNEELRDQNDRLNTRLVQYECEKMNLMS